MYSKLARSNQPDKDTSIEGGKQPRCGVVVRASVSDVLGCWFIPRSGHTKDFKSGIHSFPAWHSAGKG